MSSMFDLPDGNNKAKDESSQALSDDIAMGVYGLGAASGYYTAMMGLASTLSSGTSREDIQQQVKVAIAYSRRIIPKAHLETLDDGIEKTLDDIKKGKTAKNGDE